MNKKDYPSESEIQMDHLKKQAKKSGLSYNEAIEWMARKTGGYGTHIYSDTNIDKVKQQNEQAEQHKKIFYEKE